MKKHLAVFSGEVGELILNGKKTIESRLSQRRDPPFGTVSSGDLIYIKPAGKEVTGQFKVKKVIFYDGLEASDFKEIKQKYGKELAVDQKYWDKHKSAKYLTLIFIGESNKFITSPIKVPKKDQRGWVVLD